MTELITLADPRSAAAEAYRSLRTNLGFARPGEPLQSVLVASPSTTEDASGAVANLAVVVAEGGRRVLLVDADLRRPAQHVIWGLDNARGLTTLLVGDEAPETVVQPTSVDGLHVLTSGTLPPNPAELLASPRMAKLVTDLVTRADLVLFDTPPLLPVTDGATLAPLLDGVLLVLAARRSRRDHAVRARAVLDNVGARLLGVVLLDAAPSASAYPAYGAEGA
jgi:capsular exopolysaccharide synthesis family protein